MRPVIRSGVNDCCDRNRTQRSFESYRRHLRHHDAATRCVTRSDWSMPESRDGRQSRPPGLTASRLRGRKTWGLSLAGEQIEGLLDNRACSGAVAGRSSPVPIPYSELAKAPHKAGIHASSGGFRTDSGATLPVLRSLPSPCWTILGQLDSTRSKLLHLPLEAVIGELA